MNTGVRNALVAALLFGVSTPLAKALVGVIDPQLLAGLLYAGSGVGLVAFQLARRGGSRTVAISRTDLPYLAGAVVFGGIAAPVLLMTGLHETAASTSSLLLNLETVFTAVIAWTVFREHAHVRIVTGLLAIVAGGAVLSWGGPLSVASARGPLAIAGACLCWGIDNNLTQRIAADPVRIASVKGIVAGSANVVLSGALLHSVPAAGPLLAALVLGFLGYGVSLVLYIRALRDLGTARTGNYFSTAPFLGALAAILFFREPVTIDLLLAGVLMGVGVWLHLTERHEHVHTHEALEHEHAHVHDEHHRHAHAPGDPPGEPHTHVHRHEPIEHAHAHYPDIHHRHTH